MSLRTSVIAGAFMAALGIPAAASAAPGTATNDVNLRSGPGAGYARITTIPAGAYVEVFRCYDWCEVDYRGWHGWVSGRYVADTWRPSYRTYAPARYEWRPILYRPLIPWWAY